VTFVFEEKKEKRKKRKEKAFSEATDFGACVWLLLSLSDAEGGNTGCGHFAGKV
jgi:hypothetical protein